MNDISYKILVVEDEVDKSHEYANMIESMVDNVVVDEAEDLMESKRYVDDNIYIFISIDQNIPRKKGAYSDKNVGYELVEYIVEKQPILCAAVFTSNPVIKYSTVMERMGVEYKVKTDFIPKSEYVEYINNRIIGFEKKEIWVKSCKMLPPIIAEYCRDYLDHNEERPEYTLRSTLIFLWETIIRLCFFTLTSIAMYFDVELPKNIVKSKGHLSNNVIITHIDILINALNHKLSDSQYEFVVNEINRAFTGEFLIAVKKIQKIRNYVSHNGCNDEQARGLINDNMRAFVIILLSSSFWSRNSMITGLKVFESGTKNKIKGIKLHGLLNMEKCICDFDGQLLIDENGLYIQLRKSQDKADSIVMPLHPNILMKRNESKYRFYVPLDIRKGEYRDLYDGLIISENMPIYEKYMNKADREMKETMYFAEDSLASKVVNAVKQYYIQNDDDIDVEIFDQQYQSGFPGEEKARNIMSKINNLDVNASEYVYVSIGGGDGSEIEYIMRNMGIRYGIIIEYSDYGYQMALKKKNDLAQIESTLYVLHGDIMMKLNDAIDIMKKIKKESDVHGVCVSMQSILHELPYRSPNYDPNIFIGQILSVFNNRIISLREPSRPEGWDREKYIHLKINGFDNKELAAVSNQISDRLRFPGKALPMADGYVRMGSDLALETLFKVLYFGDIVRYRYEMDEKLTGFDIDQIVGITKNYINDISNIEVDYVISNTFRKLYKKYGVEAKTEESKVLMMPKPFVQMFAYSV